MEKAVEQAANGYIFACNSKSEYECFDRMLFTAEFTPFSPDYHPLMYLVMLYECKHNSNCNHYGKYACNSNHALHCLSHVILCVTWTVIMLSESQLFHDHLFAKYHICVWLTRYAGHITIDAMMQPISYSDIIAFQTSECTV